MKEPYLHFILGKERTGSTLLSGMLNNDSEVLSVIEETFTVYLFKKYGSIQFWSDKTILNFYNDFLLLNKQKIGFYYHFQEQARERLLSLSERNFTYEQMCKYVHLLFSKIDNDIVTVVDKQVELMFFVEDLLKIFPKSKFVVLLRDPRDNVEACIRRGLGREVGVVYQSELWNLYYRNVVNYIEDSRFLFIKYEDLIEEPEKVLKKVTNHFNIDYSKDMLGEMVIDECVFGLNNEGRKGFNDFHQGMNGGVDKSKVGVYKQNFSEGDINRINVITRELANQFGYSIPNTDYSLRWRERLEVFRTLIKKKWLLNLYYVLPVSLKLYIKKRKVGRDR